MANKHAAKEKPLFNTRLGIFLILGLGALLALAIIYFLWPSDAGIVVVHRRTACTQDNRQDT